MATSNAAFYSNVDHMQILVALMKMYNMDSTDISAIRSIGFNAHVLTNINDSVIYKANSAIRESNVLTATKLDSLYKHGREVEVAPIYSIPSTMKMVFIIPEEDFLKKSSKSGDVRTYSISKYNTVTVGNVVYSLDYNIEIRLEDGPDNEKYLTAKYIIDEETNIMSRVVNPTIKAIRVRMEDGWKYYLYLTLQQYAREIIEREIYNRDYCIYPMNTLRPTDEIAGIDIYYKTMDLSRLQTIKRLNQKLYFESSRTSEDSIFLRYDQINKFSVIHKSQEGNFRPLVGDKIIINTYTTMGERANYQYTMLEGSNIRFRSNNSNELMINIHLDGGLSSGGVSFVRTVDMLRREIITKKSTYDAIITENDLYMQLNKRSTGNLNEYSIIKYRNDILKIFNIFTILKFTHNGNSFIVPTNTLTLDWKFKTQGEEINPGEKVWMQTAKCATSSSPTTGTIISEADANMLAPGALKYWNPFILSYDQNLNMVRLYDPYVNDKYFTDYHLLNSKLPFHWICNWAQISKADYDQPLTVNFQLRHNLTNQQPKEAFFSVNPLDPTDITDLGFIKVFFVLKDKKGAEVYRARCTMDGYINDMTSRDDFFDYSITLIKPNTITKIHNDQIAIWNPDLNREVWVDVEDLHAAIEVEQPTDKDAITGLLTTGRAIVNRFTFDCHLTKNRTKDHKIQHSVIDNNTIRLHQYPLVQYDFYKKHKQHYRTAVGHEYDLEEYLAKFQGEFSYSVKFANTYGLSQNYTVGLNASPLNNVMLDMSFIVEKTLGATVTERQLNAEVFNYLNSIRFLNYDEFHISNLQKYLKDSFPRDIAFIQFTGVNGLDQSNQLISMNISKLQNKTVIEKLNLPLVYYEDERAFGYNIKWTFR